jgi:hypothetical protein
MHQITLFALNWNPYYCEETPDGPRRKAAASRALCSSKAPLAPNMYDVCAERSGPRKPAVVVSCSPPLSRAPAQGAQGGTIPARGKSNVHENRTGALVANRAGSKPGTNVSGYGAKRVRRSWGA